MEEYRKTEYTEAKSLWSQAEKGITEFHQFSKSELGSH
jgi:hypothetical protein